MFFRECVCVGGGGGMDTRNIGQGRGGARIRCLGFHCACIALLNWSKKFSLFY